VAAGLLVCIKAFRAGGLPTTESPEQQSKIFAPAGFVPTTAEKGLEKEWNDLIAEGVVRAPGAAHTITGKAHHHDE
jgi:carbon starvation protein